ncbi:cupin domain-containing protein [Buttiauxella sp. A111]|uniref:cupin domain-containing protein n=1 Tax=Buttiauxella sp. A111 TaxID=2563088 RepID=UPI0010CE1469|nr:cupin domain-containing protein [Buttiauxella sp. A111]GDX06619.1 cupin [Buttiauxella sp. A111]
MKHLTLIIAASLAFSAPVFASNGGCPVGKEGATPFTPQNAQQGEVFVHTAAEMNLGEETIHAEGWKFRARTITLSPHAVVPLHSHNDRPETVTMKQGAITIYETTCTVPYTMKEGEVYQSAHGKSHWAVNESDDYATMYVVDLVNKDTFPTSKK